MSVHFGVEMLVRIRREFVACCMFEDKALSKPKNTLIVSFLPISLATYGQYLFQMAVSLGIGVGDPQRCVLLERF